MKMLILFVMASVTALAGDYKTAAEYRAHLPCTSSVAWTGSMFPVLRGGESIAVLPAKFETLRPGQIVIVWPHDSQVPICHRLKRYIRTASATGWVLQGDNRKEPDHEIMTPETFVGVVGSIGTPKPRPKDAAPPTSLNLKHRGNFVNSTRP